MLYTINHKRLITSVIPLDFSSQKKGESDKHYAKRMAENEDRLNAALVKCKEYGWKNWLRTERQLLKRKKMLNTICKECGRERHIPMQVCRDCWKQLNESITD